MTATELYSLPMKEKRKLLLEVSGKPSKRKAAKIRELKPAEVESALATWMFMQTA